jgi:hypothetical protein
MRTTMTTARVTSAILASAAIVVSMSGCALIEPAVTKDPPTALETCAMDKTWALDLGSIEEQLTTVLTAQGVAVTAIDAQGSQTLDWSANGDVVLTTDYTVTITSAPAADQVVTVVQKHSGTSTGKAYINGDVAIPRGWDSTGFSMETTATNNGTALEDTPYVVPGTDIDDSVGLELTCSADALTVHPRGAEVTLDFTVG